METQDYILSGKWVYHIYYCVSTLVLKTSHFLRTQLYTIVYNQDYDNDVLHVHTTEYSTYPVENTHIKEMRGFQTSEFITE